MAQNKKTQVVKADASKATKKQVPAWAWVMIGVALMVLWPWVRLSLSSWSGRLERKMSKDAGPPSYMTEEQPKTEEDWALAKLLVAELGQRYGAEFTLLGVSYDGCRLRDGKMETQMNGAFAQSDKYPGRYVSNMLRHEDGYYDAEALHVDSIETEDNAKELYELAYEKAADAGVNDKLVELSVWNFTRQGSAQVLVQVLANEEVGFKPIVEWFKQVRSAAKVDSVDLDIYLVEKGARKAYGEHIERYHGVISNYLEMDFGKYRHYKIIIDENGVREKEKCAET